MMGQLVLSFINIFKKCKENDKKYTILNIEALLQKPLAERSTTATNSYKPKIIENNI